MTTLPTPDEVRAIMERRRRFGHDYMSRADFDAIVELARVALGGVGCGCCAVDDDGHFVSDDAKPYHEALDQ